MLVSVLLGLISLAEAARIPRLDSSPVNTITTVYVTVTAFPETNMMGLAMQARDDQQGDDIFLQCHTVTSGGQGSYDQASASILTTSSSTDFAGAGPTSTPAAQEPNPPTPDNPSGSSNSAVSSASVMASALSAYSSAASISASPIDTPGDSTSTSSTAPSDSSPTTSCNSTDSSNSDSDSADSSNCSPSSVESSEIASSAYEAMPTTSTPLQNSTTFSASYSSEGSYSAPVAQNSSSPVPVQRGKYFVHIHQTIEQDNCTLNWTLQDSNNSTLLNMTTPNNLLNYTIPADYEGLRHQVAINVYNAANQNLTTVGFTLLDQQQSCTRVWNTTKPGNYSHPFGHNENVPLPRRGPPPSFPSDCPRNMTLFGCDRGHELAWKPLGNSNDASNGVERDFKCWWVEGTTVTATATTTVSQTTYTTSFTTNPTTSTTSFTTNPTTSTTSSTTNPTTSTTSSTTSHTTSTTSFTTISTTSPGTY